MKKIRKYPYVGSPWFSYNTASIDITSTEDRERISEERLHESTQSKLLQNDQKSRVHFEDAKESDEESEMCKSKSTHHCTCISGEYVGESIFFLFKIGEAMLDPVVRLYIYHTTCHELYGNETCRKLDENQDIELIIQSTVANYIMGYKVLLNLPAILLGLFCGSWSDKVGRKLPVMLPCVGTIIAVILFLTSMIPGVPTILFVLLGGAVRGAFGKSAVITMALHSYVSDTSCKDDRTQRLAGLLAMNFFGYFVGSLVTGTMMEVVGFHIVFGLVAVLNCLCFFIALSCMKPSLPKTKEEKQNKNPFMLSNIKDSFTFVTRPRKDKRRCHLLIMFATVFLNQSFKSGETDVLLLFVERSPLHWSSSLYGYLLAADYICMGLGVLVILPLLVNYLRFDDVTLLILGIVARCGRLIFLACSRTTWMVFLSVVIGIPAGYFVSASKSIISKTVGEDEIGKAFSLLSCGETVSNLLGTVLLTTIYQYTSPIYPGIVFGVDSLIFLLWLFLILACSGDMRKESDYRILELETDKEVKNYGTNSPLEKHEVDGIILSQKSTEILDYRAEPVQPKDPSPRPRLPTLREMPVQSSISKSP